MKKPNGMRAWLVSVACSLSLFIAMGLNANVFGIYMPYMIEEAGLTYTQASVIQTLRMVTSLAALLCIRRVYGTRLGLRGTLALGMGLHILSRVVFALSRSFAAYCVAVCIGGPAYTMAGLVPLTLIINNWFEARRGMAIAIATMGSGVANILMPSIITAQIQGGGLRAAYLTEAAVALCVAAVSLSIIRDTPESCGCTPYGASLAPEAAKKATAGRCIGPKAWALVLAAIFISGAPLGPGYNNLTVLFSSEGASAGQISTIISLIGISLMVGKLLSGMVFDAFGSIAGTWLQGGALVAGLGLMALYGRLGFAVGIVGGVVVGFGFSMSSIAYPIWLKDLRSGPEYEKSVSRLNIAYIIGSLVFSMMPGPIADACGSYVPAYVIFCLMSVFTLAVMLSQYRTPKPENK